MKSLRSLSKNQVGSTVVEFAVTAPLFIVLLFGIVECGIAGWTQFGLQYGVQAAGRCAALQNSNCSDAQSIAQYAADNAFGLTVPASIFTVSGAVCGTQIQASYPYHFFTMFFGTPSITMTAQTCYPNPT